MSDFKKAQMILSLKILIVIFLIVIGVLTVVDDVMESNHSIHVNQDITNNSE